ncbi:hypothetical protein BJ878DRAFT_535060 [Calycina marina]|uniref:Ams2/SPT21 N-terminal domain-containing protein n=1 Tax=Calycina marina TaxID=1763456 RepID=A0A9P8CFT5_9HELO|nr:hypothetical protein BJ878DRAFT_535060 [Calycina marina]
MAPINGQGVSIRPMRLKVLYTFDDQNKTNCLARGQDVLQIQTVAISEMITIGVLDLKACIKAVVQCSPELVNRLGQDYTVYAYDYSEHDNPLVGQGMLSKALATDSPCLNAPAQQSAKLITGRVCKNILGIFNNGVPETLEVKLRLVPVHIAIQTDYLNTVERYNREMNNSPLAPGFDHNEWTKFLQTNPNMSQMTPRYGTPGSTCSNQRGSMNMEVVNQLLSPNIPQQPQQLQEPQTLHQVRGNPFGTGNGGESGGLDSGHETDGGKSTKGKKPRAPAKTAVKRPRAKRQPQEPKSSKAYVNNVGGNTSEYEEGTDGDYGDDGPAPRKRAKITQTDWNSRSAFGQPTDSLRKTASTAGSLRLFRPIAVASGNNPLEEVPRPPTPLPKMAVYQEPRTQRQMRRASFVSMPDQGRIHVSPYPSLPPQDVRHSIESANTSPERHSTPVITPPEIASSPPMMRSVSPLHMRSSPPCPSSPVLPQMPRMDSGFMSGSLEEQSWEEVIFGPMDGSLTQFQATNLEMDLPQLPIQHHEQRDDDFYIEEEAPGPMDMLPSTMRLVPPKAKVPPRIPVKPVSQSSKTMAGPIQQFPASVIPSNQTMSQPSQPAINRQGSAPPALTLTDSSASASLILPQDSAPSDIEPVPGATSAHISSAVVGAPQPRQGSRLARTNSMGSIPTNLITQPAQQRSSLHRSQTWSDTPPQTTGPMHTAPSGMPVMSSGLAPMQFVPSPAHVPKPVSAQAQAKQEKLQKRLENALAKGELPPFCSNCGVIKTATWRTSWSQDHLGVPGYYDFSDEPGHISCVVILTRDADNKPTSYKLIKRFLGKTESKEHWKEYILCNPCGLWMTKYNFQRPEDKWECNKGKGRFRKRPSRAKDANGNYLTSDATFPQSEGYFPQSEANYPPLETAESVADARSSSEAVTTIDGAADAGTPSEVVVPMGSAAANATSPVENRDIQVQRVELTANQTLAIKLQPTKMKRLNPMTSDAASDALRRAIRSSPARWKRRYSAAETRGDSEMREGSSGARDSPIELDDSPDPTRRLLFPSPRKDCSLKVLGEASANVSRISPRNRSSKVLETDLPNKENCSSPIEDDEEDAELLRLFEEELARPSTPVQGALPANQFKTPTRPTPNHRPITRSVSRSARSARLMKSPGELLRFSDRRTPNKTPTRRSPRNHNSYWEPPFAPSINKMMADASNHLSPSQHVFQNIVFSNLPDLPLMDDFSHHNGNADQEFSLEDFFSTDMVMPSSPPRNFNLHEDPVDWSEFNSISNTVKQTETQVIVKEEPAEPRAWRESMRRMQPMPKTVEVDDLIHSNS